MLLVSLDSIYDCVSIESMESCCPSVDGITRITPQTLAIQKQNLEKTKKLIANKSIDLQARVVIVTYY